MCVWVRLGSLDMLTENKNPTLRMWGITQHNGEVSLCVGWGGVCSLVLEVS